MGVSNTQLILMVVVVLIAASVFGLNISMLVFAGTAIWIFYDLLNTRRAAPTQYWRGQPVPTRGGRNAADVLPRVLFALVLLAVAGLAFIPAQALWPTVLAILFVCGAGMLIAGWQAWNQSVIGTTSAKYWRGQRIEAPPRRMTLPPAQRMIAAGIPLAVGALVVLSGIVALI